MIRILRLFVLRSMAAVAVLRRSLVHTVPVTRLTLLRRVHSRQGERRMRELCLAPARIAELVAAFACRRHPGRHVVWILRLFVLRPMATVAVARRSPVHTLPMAGLTYLRRMPSRKRECRVIVFALVPTGVCELMTAHTTRRKSRRSVIRVSSLFVLRLVAAIAVPSRPLVDTTSVTGGTRLGRVHSSQREACVTGSSLLPRCE